PSREHLGAGVKAQRSLGTPGEQAQSPCLGPIWLPENKEASQTQLVSFRSQAFLNGNTLH
ncbi:hypothetical protein Q8G71_33185, partial [Klebsiella pneumoniae]